MKRQYNLEGRVFSYLTVDEEGEPYRYGPNGIHRRWWCVCALCGNRKLVGQGALISGAQISCGCKKSTIPEICPKHNIERKARPKGQRGFHCVECTKERRRKSHIDNIEKQVVQAAKCRAKRLGLTFNLTPEDISIPEYCPILGIPIIVGGLKLNDNSPTIDRVIPACGYTKTNIRIISWRANRIKSDASLSEIEAICRYLKGE